MSRRLPVTIVTGYLGAGKTTLINDLLAQEHGKRITILVNDFGEVAIDEDLILSRDGDTIALANGCMCCSLGDDLFDALDRILRMPRLPDHLVIETSGVADPGKIRQIALAEPMLEHRGTVTLLDPVNLAAALDEPVLSDTIRRQLAAATLVVVSKADLCDAAQMTAATPLWRAHAPSAVSVVAAGGIPAELLLGEFEIVAPAATGGCGRDHLHQDVYRSWTRDMAAPVPRRAMEALLARKDLGIYRLKGFVRLEDGIIATVQKAGLHWSIEPLASGSLSPALRLVAIGRANALDVEAAECALQAAMREHSPV